MTLRGQQTLEYSVKIKQNILEIFFFLNECFIYAFVKNFDQNKFYFQNIFQSFSVGKNCASCGTEREHRNQKGGTTEVLPPQCRRRQKLCRPVAPNGT